MKIKAKFLDDFDIIENDENKEYGYAYIYQGEGISAADDDSCISGWKDECFKNRLEANKKYKEAITSLESEASSYSWGCHSEFSDAIKEYFDWWMTTPPSEKEIDEMKVEIISEKEADELLLNGFIEPRRFIRVEEDPYKITIKDGNVNREYLFCTPAELKKGFETLIKEYEGNQYSIENREGEFISGAMDPDDIYEIAYVAGFEPPAQRRPSCKIPGLVFIYYYDGSGHAEINGKSIAKVDLQTREFMYPYENTWHTDIDIDKYTFEKIVEEKLSQINTTA